MHAIGHALMALVASALALSVATRWAIAGRAPAAATGVEAALNALSPTTDPAFFLSLVGLAVVIVKGVAGVYASYVQVRVAGHIGCALRLDLLDALLRLHRLRQPRQPRQDDQGSDSAPTARAVVALTDRVRDVEAGLARGLLGSVRAIAQLVPIAAMLALLSGRMAAAAAVVLATFGWALGRLRSRYRQASARSAQENERLHEAADDSVRHADLWITYGAERKVRTSVHSLGEALAHGSAWLEARAATMSAANEVLAAMALVGAMGASRAGWLGSVASRGTLLAFAVAFFLAYRPLRELADARLAMARAEGAFEDLRRVIERARACVDVEPSTPAHAAARTWTEGPL
jgi:ABC-type multidrug transport system fused ATPase/permease subunit